METWKDIYGLELRYQVSNHGRVRFKGNKRSNFECTYPKMLATNQGYHKVAMRVEGKNKQFFVHRLVAYAFLPNTHNKPFVNHKNGIKSDNRVINLEWCTPVENARHAWATGLKTASPQVKGRPSNWYKQAKPVVALDDAGNVVKRYDCGYDADRDLKLSRGSVCRSVREGIRAKGFHFKYA
jgi:hypothetical protein